VEPQRVIGRYALFEAIAAGGMATVYYGRLLGPVGFSRTVAIKQLHPQFSRDPDFVSMFVDEARLAARLRHPHVVPVLDVVMHGRELYIIMEYVLGVSLSELLRRLAMRDEHIPRPVVSALIVGALEGLHAAHETRDERGDSLGIVHRDVSPANILVGRDGLSRVLDFGIAKAAGRAQVTRHGEIKGKVGYMALEQLRGDVVTRAADIHAVAVTLWEALTSRRGFRGDPDDVIDARLSGNQLPPPSTTDAALAPFDSVIARGVAAAPGDRWPDARAMASALAAAMTPATTAEVASWLEDEASSLLAEREKVVASLEAGASASEVRAAIRKDLSLSEPAISVDSWSGSEEELARLWESGSAAWESLEPASNSSSAATARRDDVPTVVDSGTFGAPRTSAPPPDPMTPSSAPAMAEAGPPRFDESTTRIAEPDSTPPWLEPKPAAAIARGLPRGAVASAATAAVVVAVIVIAMLMRSSAPSTAATSTPATSVHAAGATASPATALPARTVAEPPTEATTAPPPIEPSATASTSASVAKPTPRPPVARPPRPTSDPFDSLGGRH
jgi:eukaryotic-like serine/threonine-protein kinase